VSDLKFDPSRHGLRNALKEYKELDLRNVWEIGEEGAGSGLIWKVVNEKLKLRARKCISEERRIQL
jgi:hypothetical protein